MGGLVWGRERELGVVSWGKVVSGGKVVSWVKCKIVIFTSNNPRLCCCKCRTKTIALRALYFQDIHEKHCGGERGAQKCHPL